MKWKEVNIALGFVLLVSMILMIFTGCKKDEDIDLSLCIKTAEIVYGEDKYEVYVDRTDTSITHIYKNGRHQETDKSSKSIEIPMSGEFRMFKLPELNTYKELNRNKKITSYAYKSTLVDSTEHLNYLKHSGYTEVFRAVTPTYIEVYMQLKASENLFTRLIIMSGYIVEYNTDAVYFDIKNYV